MILFALGTQLASYASSQGHGTQTIITAFQFEEF